MILFERTTIQKLPGLKQKQHEGNHKEETIHTRFVEKNCTGRTYDNWIPPLIRT